MWKCNSLKKLLQIQFPIIQAPMAGVSFARLAAEVSNAGGLGSLGTAYLSPEEIRQMIKETRALTSAPFAVNLFAQSKNDIDLSAIKKAQQSLEKYRKELALPPLKSFQNIPSFDKQMEVILEEKPPVFSFTFGVPPLSFLIQLKKMKVVLIGTATTVEEALLLEKSGVDLIVAQGFEAGGHRATFLKPAEDPYLGMLPLISQIKSNCEVPIIAAGGIMTGEDIAAALSVGAAGVQLGTAFLCCPESRASSAHKRALLQGDRVKTILTSKLTGRFARVLKNKFTMKLEENNDFIAPFPYQHYLTKDIRSAAARLNLPEWMSLYAGQGYPFSSTLPAKEIIANLVQQTESLFKKIHCEFYDQETK